MKMIININFVVLVVFCFSGCINLNRDIRKKNLESLRALHNKLAVSVLSDPLCAENPRTEKLFEEILGHGLANQALAVYVLSRPEWFKKSNSVEWSQKIVFKDGPGALSLIQFTLVQDIWANDRGAEVVRFAIGRKVDDPTGRFQYYDQVLVETLKANPWQKHPDIVLELVERMILTGIASSQALIALLETPALTKHPIKAKLLYVYRDLLIAPNTISLGHRLLRWFRIRTVTGGT